jgi:hypothetical protein
VVDSIAFLHILVDSNSSDVIQVVGHSIYRMLASHWRITGPCPNGTRVFSRISETTVCNIYRKAVGVICSVWNLAQRACRKFYIIVLT